MKKKLLNASLLLANVVLSTTAVAGGVNTPAYSHETHVGAHAAPRLFTGFSVTGALGGIMGDADITQSSFFETGLGPLFHVAQLFVDEPDLSETSFAGMIGLEYDYQFSSGLLLGLAVTASFDNLELKNTEMEVTQQEVTQQNISTPTNAHDTSTLTVSFKNKLKNDFAILVKPGFVVRRNTLLYALIGPRWGNFDSQLSGTTNTQGVFVTESVDYSWDTTASDTDKSSGYQLGFTAGAGIQQAITDHFRLGIEYAYSRYPNMDALSVADHKIGPPENLTTAAMVASVDSYTFVTHSVMATVSYFIGKS